MEIQPAIYELPGAKVAVHMPFGSQHYFAVVELDGALSRIKQSCPQYR